MNITEINYDNIINNNIHNIIHVRTKDYRRVCINIIKSIEKYNNNHEDDILEYKIYSNAIETFTGDEITEEELIQAFIQNKPIIFIYILDLPFSQDIFYYFHNFILKDYKTKLFILDPSLKIETYAEPYVYQIDDYYPTELSITMKDLPIVEGLSEVEIYKGKKENNLEKYRDQILKKSDGILELIKPKNIDNPLGLSDTINMIDKAFKSNIGKGSLLIGVPGTGKSLIAKYLSKNNMVIKFNFGRVFSKYVGSSEERLESTLKRLESFNNSYIFIDEFEKLLSSSNNSNGVNKRILGSFLSWLQDKESNNYIIATINNMLNLPLELVRTGRWDFIFSLLPPNNKKILGDIEKYYQQKYNINIDFELRNIINIVPADIESIYRIASFIGKKAKDVVRMTKDIHPDKFNEMISIAKSIGYPAYKSEKIINNVDI